MLIWNRSQLCLVLVLNVLCIVKGLSPCLLLPSLSPGPGQHAQPSSLLRVLQLRGGGDVERDGHGLGHRKATLETGVLDEENGKLLASTKRLLSEDRLWQDEKSTAAHTMRMQIRRLLSRLQAKATELKHRAGRPHHSVVEFIETVQTISTDFVKRADGIDHKYKETHGLQSERGEEKGIQDTSGGSVYRRMQCQRAQEHEAARRALLADAYQSTLPITDDEDQTLEDAQTDNLLDQLGSAVNKFKGIATQNLQEVQKSLGLVDEVAETIMKNIPLFTEARAKVAEQMRIFAKSKRRGFMAYMSTLGMMLAAAYIIMKVKG